MSFIISGYNSWPTITIVTPSFNQGRYLERTILSVLEQKYSNLEYIIIDGGSTDNSVEIIKKYEKYLKYWVSEPDRGQSHAINKGFELATGDIFGWLNSDDYFVEGSMAIISNMYRHNPNAGAFVGAGEFVDLKCNVLSKKVPPKITLDILYNWLNEFYIMQPSCFFSKKAWMSVGGLDESVHFAMDVDLWLRIAKKYSFETTTELLSRSLVHKAAKTTANRYFCEIDTALVIMKNGGEQQAHRYFDRLAARFECYEKWLKPFTANPLFNFVLPYLKRIIGYDRQLESLYPRWKKK